MLATWHTALNIVMGETVGLIWRPLRPLVPRPTMVNIMDLITSNTLTMTSQEIADLVESRHDHVKRSIDRLVKAKAIKLPPMKEIKTATKPVSVYDICKRDSYVIVAQLSPVFTARLVDRWQELEKKDQFQVPQTLPEALRLAADLAQKIEEDRPKIEYHDAVLCSKNGIATTEIASELKMSAVKLNKILSSMKVQRKIGRRWVLTTPYLGQDLSVEATHVDDGGKSRHCMKWTEKGRKFILELVGNQNS